MPELILQDGNKVNLPLSIPEIIDCAYKTIKGDIVGIDDISVVYKLSIPESIQLITNPIFGQLVHHLTIANARHSFDAIAFKNLIQIARFSEDERNKISAIKALGDMVGMNESRKSSSNPVVNINIDKVVRDSESVFKGF